MQMFRAGSGNGFAGGKGVKLVRNIPEREIGASEHAALDIQRMGLQRYYVTIDKPNVQIGR
jgi:hypothetical protein